MLTSYENNELERALHESILSEMARNEVVFRELEEQITEKCSIVAEGFENIPNDLSHDKLQHVYLQTKEMIEGTTKLLDMISNRLEGELSESARVNLKMKQLSYMQAVDQFVGLQQILDEIITAYQPVASSANTQDVERENKKLQESQKELQNKLGKEQKLVADLRKQLQEQSNKSCVVCLDEEANIVFIPCGHLCTCISCSSRLGNLCPICRSNFTSSIQVYNP